MINPDQERILRKKVIDASSDYYRCQLKPKASFTPGDKINYGGRIFDEQEINALVDASLDFWLTGGRYVEKFEKKFCEFLGVAYCSLTNSGSSANLLAFIALTSPKLNERQIKKGDEVITVAAAFPTTVAPIIQYGAVPVFVDVTLPSCNIDCTKLREALSPKTKAVMIAHAMGNPFDLENVKKFCDEHNLWLVEDNCDALGAQYHMNGSWHYTGTIGDIGTSSFYPPHHMTMGEGGAVYTSNKLLKKIIDSFRDWGRDCWCSSGKDNRCRKRFQQKFSQLPFGYDHKYVYSHFGYNLKATEMQAAIGCAQLLKLPAFIEARNHNWQDMQQALNKFSAYFIFPEATENSKPSWFGYTLTIKDNAPFTRDQLVEHLEGKNIQTRMLFAGNLIKHPCFDELRLSDHGYRIVGNLNHTDKIMESTFWLGVYPGITQEMLSYIIETIITWVTRWSGHSK